MNSILEIQLEFNKQLISGIAYHFLNNPIISWENGFLQGLTALCSIIALVKIFSSSNNPQAFSAELLSFGFYLALVFANFGVINPREYFSLGLVGNYDYMSKDTPPSSKELNINYVSTKPTLDREIYNAISMFANDMAASIRGSGPVTQAQIQTNAIASTVMFLKQVQLAKFNCVGYEKETASKYAGCIGGYIPSLIPIASDGTVVEKVCRDSVSGALIICKNGFEEETASGDTEASMFSKGIISAVTPDFLETIAKYITSAYLYVVLFFSEPLITLVLPALLGLVEIVRSAVGFVMLIGFGFASAGTMFFAKLISPLIILDRFRGQVISAYKLVFATTLFGFVAELFVFFSTILTLGMRDACFNIVIPYLLKGQGESGVEFAILSATLSIMVYIAVTSVLVIQVYSLVKIPDACKALMNLQVETFVSMGAELAGVGAKLGMAVGAAVLAAPALIAGGAAIAAGGAGAGAIGGLAAGTGKLGAIASKAGSLGKMAVKGAQVATNVGRKAGAVVSKYGGGAADFVYGKDAGDSVRKALGTESYSGNKGGADTSTIKTKTQEKTDSKLKEAKDEAKGKKKNKKNKKEESSESTAAGFKAKTDNKDTSSGSGNSSDPTMPNFKKNKKLLDESKSSKEEGEDRRPGFMRMVDKIPGAKFATRGAKAVFDTVYNNAGKMGLDSTLKSNAQGFGGTAIGTLASNAGKMSKNIESGLKNLEKDPESREKFAKFREFVGANSAEDKAESYSDLSNAIDERSSKQELSIEEAARYQELSSKKDLSSEETAEAYRLSKTKNFVGEEQQSALKNIQQNKAFKKYEKQKEFEYSTAMSQYMSGSDTLGNTKKLKNLISEGAGDFSRQMSRSDMKNYKSQVDQVGAIVDQYGEIDTQKTESYNNQSQLDQFKQQNRERLDSTVSSSLNPAISAMNELKNNKDLTQKQQEEYQQTVNKAVGNFTSSSSLMSSVIGNDKFADLAVQSKALNQEEAEMIKKSKSRQQVVSQMESALNDLSSDLNLSNGSAIRDAGSYGLSAFDVNDNQIGKIKLSDLSDPQERAKMETILNNIEIILGKYSSNAFIKPDGSNMFSPEQIAKMAKIKDLFEK